MLFRAVEMNAKTLDPEIVEVRKAIDTLYTPLGKALELLCQRRGDEKLRTAVADFHRAYPPDFLPDVPCAFWTRHISTPNREFELFVSTASATGLRPLCLEYTEDIFVVQNRDKYRLCRPFFEVRPHHFRGLSIMGATGLHGQRLCDLRLMNGMPLLEFHHALLGCAFPDFDKHLRDYSRWLTTARRNGDFYLHYLALFICDGILFENFIATDPEERRFARERMLPSVGKALENFGVKPLIVQLLPSETEHDEHWRSHSGALHPVALNLVQKQNRNMQQLASCHFPAATQKETRYEML